jgi:hypothetical protein
MSSAFEGSLRLVGSNDSLAATVSLDAGEMTITSGGHQIGQWDLDEMELVRQPDGFRIRVEGEELAVSVKNPAAFAAAVGMADQPNARGSRRGRGRKRERSAVSAGVGRSLGTLGSWFGGLPIVARVAILAAPFVIVFGVVATFTLAAIMVLAGMLALIVGGFALSDDPTVYTLDARVPEWALPAGGLVLIVGGIGLMVFF